MRYLILEEVFHTLENDPQLKALSGGNVPGGEVRVYSGRASRDPILPYIVFAVHVRYSPDLVSAGYLLIDLWDYGRNSARIELMAERVRHLFHRMRIANTSVRFILQSDDTVRDFTRNNGSIRNNQEQVFQDAVQFQIRGCDPGLLAVAVAKQPLSPP